ncbi:hypothetical protein [Staphylococcus epidermidis]|uniref:hypothetical protein n=1 Tax=Staphylococcus epidermidis TaxID=1282 RepID=UPI00119D959A|nr:hypothetical protein [Staphylococcus epidermidis]
MSEEYGGRFVWVGEGDGFYSENKEFGEGLKRENIGVDRLLYDGWDELDDEYEFDVDKGE